MKKWAFSLAASTGTCTIGLIYFTLTIVQDGCLDSGGRWLGLTAGCEGGTVYSLTSLSSPLSIAIFLGILLGVASAFVQTYDIFFKPKQNNLRSRSKTTSR